MYLFLLFFQTNIHCYLLFFSVQMKHTKLYFTSFFFGSNKIMNYSRTVQGLPHSSNIISKVIISISKLLLLRATKMSSTDRRACQKCIYS